MTKAEGPFGQEEPILYRATIHWVSLLGPAIILAIGAILLQARPLPALVTIGAGVIWGVVSACNVLFSELVVTPTKITVRTGFPFARVHEFPYTLITHVDVNKPPLGVALRFGKITIAQSDGKWMTFTAVKKPNELIARLRQEIAHFRQENGPDAAGEAE